MAIDRCFVAVLIVFFTLNLTACGSTPDQRATAPSAATPSSDPGAEIGSYQVALPIEAFGQSSQEEIATRLFNAWLEHFKSDAVDPRIRLQDYKIQEVTIPPEFQPCIKDLDVETILIVKYSVLPFRPPSPDWDAGSGSQGNAHWVIINSSQLAFLKRGTTICLRIWAFRHARGSTE